MNAPHDDPRSVVMADLVEAWAPTGGGIRSWIEAKAAALEELGHRHLLVVPGPRDRIHRTGTRTIVEVGSPRIPGCAPYRFLLRRRPVARALERFRPKVVELGSQYRLGSVVASHASRHPVRVSAFFHTDLAGAYVGPWGRRILGRHAGEWLARRAEHHVAQVFTAADVALVSSPSNASRLRELGIASPHLLPLGVDLEVFSPQARDSSIRARYTGGDADARLLVFLGRLDGEKRVPLLIEAFRRARQTTSRLHLLLVGDGPLVDRIPGWQHETRGIHHRAWEEDRRQVASLLASSDAYVTAGPHETFGLAVLEAQAAGLPVLGVDAGALQDRVDHGCGFLVPAEDPEALAGGMIELANLPAELLQAKGRASRARAHSGGGWDRTLSEAFALYGISEAQTFRPANDDSGVDEGRRKAVVGLP